MNAQNRLTADELTAFKAHLVAVGEAEQAHVKTAPMRRDWSDILEAGEPALFAQGKFDFVLERAINSFIESRERAARERLKAAGDPRLNALRNAVDILRNLHADETFVYQLQMAIQLYEKTV